MQDNKWINVDDRLPDYGKVVLIKANGVTQNVTYMLDGCDHSADWFEPYYFDHEGEDKIWYHKVDAWIYLPE